MYGLTRPHDTLITRPLSRTSSHGHLSFEQMCRANETASGDWGVQDEKNDDDDRQRVEMMSQRDIMRLQPLLWLELTAVFDKYNVPLTKRKPNKRRRKGKYLSVFMVCGILCSCLMPCFVFSWKFIRRIAIYTATA